jgi:hypothetical protein
MENLAVGVALVSALIAVGAMCVAIAQASEAEKSRKAAERQAETAEKALLLATEQHNAQLQQRQSDLDQQAYEQIIAVGTRMLEHASLIRQAVNMIRGNANGAKAAQNVSVVAHGYVSLMQVIATIPKSDRYASAMKAVVEETGKVQDAISNLHPLETITPERVDALADALQDGYSRIFQDALKANRQRQLKEAEVRR